MRDITDMVNIGLGLGPFHEPTTIIEWIHTDLRCDCVNTRSRTVANISKMRVWNCSSETRPRFDGVSKGAMYCTSTLSLYSTWHFAARFSTNALKSSPEMKPSHIDTCSLWRKIRMRLPQEKWTQSGYKRGRETIVRKNGRRELPCHLYPFSKKVPGVTGLSHRVLLCRMCRSSENHMTD